jgi:hypothetical protein
VCLFVRRPSDMVEGAFQNLILDFKSADDSESIAGSENFELGNPPARRSDEFTSKLKTTTDLYINSYAWSPYQVLGPGSYELRVGLHKLEGPAQKFKVVKGGWRGEFSDFLLSKKCNGGSFKSFKRTLEIHHDMATIDIAPGPEGEKFMEEYYQELAEVWKKESAEFAIELKPNWRQGFAESPEQDDSLLKFLLSQVNASCKTQPSEAKANLPYLLHEIRSTLAKK